MLIKRTETLVDDVQQTPDAPGCWPMQPTRLVQCVIHFVDKALLFDLGSQHHLPRAYVFQRTTRFCVRFRKAYRCKARHGIHYRFSRTRCINSSTVSSSPVLTQRNPPFWNEVFRGHSFHSKLILVLLCTFGLPQRIFEKCMCPLALRKLRTYDFVFSNGA